MRSQPWYRKDWGKRAMKESDWEDGAGSQCHQEWLGSSHPPTAHGLTGRCCQVSAASSSPAGSFKEEVHLKAPAPLLFLVGVHLIPQHVGFVSVAVGLGFFYFIVLEDGTDESLAKLKCFEPSGCGRLFQIVPCIAVKPQVTPSYQLLFRIFIHGLCQPMCCHFS